MPNVNPLEMVAQFQTALTKLEAFDRQNVRPKVVTKADHPPREFAIVSTYLRALAQVRTLIELGNAEHFPSHFQAIAMIARALFELGVEIHVIDRVENGPQKHATFSDLERLRTARVIVAFHHAGNVEEPLGYLWVHEKFIEENASSVEGRAKELWPTNPQPTHWSAMKLRKRAILAGRPFEEIYNVEYAELSWYTHPGVGAVATLAADIYPIVCGKAYGVAIRCYIELLRFMLSELNLAASDPLIAKRLEFARLVAFASDQAEVNQLKESLLRAES